MNEVQRLGVEHREGTGHKMAVIDGKRASCAECDFSVRTEGPLGVVTVSHEDE